MIDNLCTVAFMSYLSLSFITYLTGDFQFVPSLPPPPERDVPLRDKMLKQPDNSDRFSHKQDDFVSVLILYKICDKT